MAVPGLGTLWIKKEVEFLRPAFFGHRYRAVVTVTEIDRETNTVTLSTECFNQAGDKIVTGSAVVKPIPAKVKARMLDDGLLRVEAAG